MYETFQYSDWETRWSTWHEVTSSQGYTGEASVSRVITPAVLSKSLRLYAGGRYWYYLPGVILQVCGTQYVENIVPDPSDYWSFIIRGWSQSSTWRDGGGSASVVFLSEAGQPLGSYTLGGRDSPVVLGLYEFVRVGFDVYLVINGESKGVIFSCNATPAYIRFQVGGCGIFFTLDIDSVYNTPDAGMVDVAIEPESRTLTDLANSRIECCWCVTTLPYDVFRGSEYRIRATHINTGTVVLDSVVKAIPVSYVVDPPYGTLVWDRANMQGLYGAYLLELLKNGAMVATDFLQYVPYSLPAECDQRVAVTDTTGAPVSNALIEVREYLTNQIVTTGATDAAGEWSTVLGTANIYSVQVSKGQQTQYYVIVPCYENPVSFMFLPPEPSKKSWLIPALLATLGASGGATWALSE
jgi:hypothetical protein